MLGAGEVTDGLVTVAQEQSEDDHLAEAQVVVGVALGGEATTEAHDSHTEL